MVALVIFGIGLVAAVRVLPLRAAQDHAQPHTRPSR
jgi:hypothetical protein